MGITRQQAERITQYLDVCTSVPEHADLVLVFGTRHAKPAHIAANLYKGGIGRYVVLTGGSNPLTHSVEARAHLKAILQGGVPRERIIVESVSTNTLENTRSYV